MHRRARRCNIILSAISSPLAMPAINRNEYHAYQTGLISFASPQLGGMGSSFCAVRHISRVNRACQRSVPRTLPRSGSAVIGCMHDEWRHKGPRRPRWQLDPRHYSNRRLGGSLLCSLLGTFPWEAEIYILNGRNGKKSTSTVNHGGVRRRLAGCCRGGEHVGELQQTS